MDQPDPILHKVSVIISENMGQNAGEDFFSLFKTEDEDAILEGASAILRDLLGPETADKTLKELRNKK